jgi:hypothetical protein
VEDVAVTSCDGSMRNVTTDTALWVWQATLNRIKASGYVQASRGHSGCEKKEASEHRPPAAGSGVCGGRRSGGRLLERRAHGETELTLFLDLSPWFADGQGSLVDPRTATDGGANQSLVENNIKRSIDVFEDRDHDGRRDDAEGGSSS